jgi:hypothetical protein
MALIRDKEIRRQITEVFKAFRKNFPNDAGELTLKQFDQMCSILGELRKEANLHTAAHHQREISNAYLSIWTLAIICLALDPKRGRRSKQLSKNGKFDSWVLQNLLLQIVNYSLAVVRLVEDGLDNPACCVLRSLNELCCQFIVLSADSDKLAAYAKLESPSEAKQIWYELFAKKGRLGKNLSDLEARVGLPSSLVSTLSSYRDHVNTFNSQAVHHSFASAVIRAYVGDFNSEEDLHFGLFGKASPASDSTLYDLNTILVYTLAMFLRVLANVYNFKAPLKDKLWREVHLLTACVQKVNGSKGE